MSDVYIKLTEQDVCFVILNVLIFFRITNTILIPKCVAPVTTPNSEP